MVAKTVRRRVGGVRWLIVLAFCVYQISLRAQEEPVPIDPFDPRISILKMVQQFQDVHNPFTWLFGSIIVTLKSYQTLKGVLSDARSSRAAALKQLHSLRLERDAMARGVALFDSAAQSWDQIDEQARKAISELSIEYRRLNQIPKNRREKWLLSPQGIAWRENFDEMTRVLHGDLDEAYRSVVRAAQALFPEQYATVPMQRTEKFMSRKFVASSAHLDHQYERLNSMENHIDSLKTRCQGALSRLSVSVSQAGMNSQLSSHLGWKAAVGAAGTLGGTVGIGVASYTFKMRYGRNPVQLSAEANKRNQAKLNAEIDLCGQVSSPEGRVRLVKTRDIINDVLASNRDAIINSLRNRISEHDTAQLARVGYTLDNLERFMSESGHVHLAFERALCVAGKRTIGERATLAQVLSFLYPKESAVRDIERPAFLHDFYVQFFNSIWSQLGSTGGGANRITEDLMIGLEVDTIKRLDRVKEPIPTPGPTPGLSSTQLRNEASAGRAIVSQESLDGAQSPLATPLVNEAGGGG